MPSLSQSLSRFLAFSLSRFLAFSLSRFLAFSLSRFLAFSLSRFLTFSLSRFLALFLSLSLSFSLSSFSIYLLSLLSLSLLTLHRYREGIFEFFNKLHTHLNGKLAYIAIYGEIFGGFYPHETITDLGLCPVQKEIYYNDKIDFYAFDTRVHEEGDESQYWLDYKLAMKLFKECGFFYAEPLLVGTLEEVITSFPSLTLFVFYILCLALLLSISLSLYLPCNPSHLSPVLGIQLCNQHNNSCKIGLTATSAKFVRR
jgi:RNA ligase